MASEVTYHISNNGKRFLSTQVWHAINSIQPTASTVGYEKAEKKINHWGLQVCILKNCL